MNKAAESIDTLVGAVRHAAMEFGCRLEISSDERLPVSASTQDRKFHGFGSTIQEAHNRLQDRIGRSLVEAADQKAADDFRKRTGS